MYRRGNKSKIITSLVLVAVLTISIGYAAFSNTLRITPQATITPDSANFDIDFSKVSTGVDASDVTPSLTGTGITAKAAEIDNSTSPTITNLSVEFTEPGQKAEYSFYAYNNGQYLAYLNSINFINPDGKDAFITCTADSSDTHYVDDACAGIKVSIQIVPTDSSIETITTDATKENIQGHSLAKTSAEQVIVTIEYESGSARADGPFSVDIGDITLVYTTLDSTSVATAKACTYDGELVQGAKYDDGICKYVYKQQQMYNGDVILTNVEADEWAVTYCRTSIESNKVVVGENCSTINGKPVTSMNFLFAYSEFSIASLDLSNLNTSTIKSMEGMFMYMNSDLDLLDLSSFDMSNVTNTGAMFEGTTIISGYAKTQEDADRLNAAYGSNIFTVK